MIKIKILIYLFTIFFNFQYFANSQSLEMEYKISKPPLCKNNNGKNVYFKNKIPNLCKNPDFSCFFILGGGGYEFS